MSQIAGRKIPQDRVPTTNFIQASVDRTDANENGGLHVLMFGGALTTYIDEASPTVVYIGEAASGTKPSQAGWRICKIEEGIPTKITWAYLPATSIFPVRAAGFDHIWDSRASLPYA